MGLSGLASRIMTDPVLLHRGRLVAAALSFIVLLGSGIAWATYQNFTTHVPHGSPVPPLAPGQPDLDGKDQNILLVGNDSRPGATPAELKQLATVADDGTVNTDTMMVLHLPADGSRPTIISFPRDSWVDIPGHGKGKLNSAYSVRLQRGQARRAGRARGAERRDHAHPPNPRRSPACTSTTTCRSTCSASTGSARRSAACRYACYTRRTRRPTPTPTARAISGIDLPAGRSAIKGAQALAFVRQRHGLPHGDLDRIKRQQYFLSAAFHKITSAGTLLNPFKLPPCCMPCSPRCSPTPRSTCSRWRVVRASRAATSAS